MPDSDGPAATQSDNDAPSDNQAAEPVPSSADTQAQDEHSDQQNTGNRETLGGTLKNHFVRSVQGTGAVRKAKRMYDLTYGSSMAHGDKKVLREQVAFGKMQSNPDLSHNQAIRQAKAEIRDVNRENRKGPEQ